MHQAFDRQVRTLLDKGYAPLAGLDEGNFVRRLAPLRDRLNEVSPSTDDRRITFVLVPGTGLVPRVEAAELLSLRGKAGFTTMEPGDLAGFTPLDGLDLPADSPYLLVDVDTGPDTLNLPPENAMPQLVAASRSPLTVDEGLALVTHHPEVLRSANCFSMLGSRCGDRRVTALWVSAGRPRLGWCWAGAPHTWLGSASCASRLTA